MQHFKASLALGIIVFLILYLFQPFGTYGYIMDYKTLFLLGYGIICSSVYFGYYFLAMKLAPSWFDSAKWNLAREMITLAPFMILVSQACLYYHYYYIGGYKINLFQNLYFLKISFMVSIIPFSIILYLKWLKSNIGSIRKNQKSTESNETQNVEKTTQAENLLTFESNNKKEKAVVIPESNLLFIKSSGNYIEINEIGLGKPHLIRNSLSKMESILDENTFVKAHRSYIINLHFIEDVVLRDSSYFAQLKNNYGQIPLSRTKVKEIRELLELA
ncbi:LytR/AlgR family response regulator transcription factor [Aureibacter tunicatorum]|uniref:HTH LytTR-type domain-containing protein n=1 Tax=Aureibacter tunicatorum TaxID=866807 RepID=A0AAE3XJZ7_9BACT|nr:LytTR family DNA-binding domain-containing protein [Aureibacter tunicatorum]MDR6237905.1 hypothetical protein [Aureibacter tunicatorum]